MAKLNITVRLISTDDKSRWNEMWEDYLKFYKKSLSTDIRDATWRRFFDKATPMYCSIAEDNSGQGLGFAIYVTHPGSWGIGDVCYLEDLYVIPEFRCEGIGRKMIKNLIELSTKNN